MTPAGSRHAINRIITCYFGEGMGRPEASIKRVIKTKTAYPEIGAAHG